MASLYDYWCWDRIVMISFMEIFWFYLLQMLEQHNSLFCDVSIDYTYYHDYHFIGFISLPLHVPRTYLSYHSFSY